MGYKIGEKSDGESVGMVVLTRRRGIQPFSSSRLTPTEQAVENEQEHNTCVTCDWLGKQRRSGLRTCEQGNEPGPVLSGEVVCRDYLKFRRQ